MTYIHWQRYPFVKILPVLLVGIFLGNTYTSLPLLGVLGILFVGLLVYGLAPIKKWVQSLIIYSCLLLLGIALTLIQAPKSAEIPIPNTVISATILGDMEEKAKTYKTEAKIVYTDSSKQLTSTKSVFYIQKSEAAKNLKIGDEIAVQTTFKALDKPLVPGTFDYSKYMARKGVFFTSYLKTDQWAATGEIDNSLMVRRLAAAQRIHFSKVIDEYVDSSASGLIKAISIGLKTDLETDTKTSFSKAGIMHILAVSGMHVGIVWSLLALILNPLRKAKPSLKIATILFEIVCIWMFAFITGFEPSVQRAAFMFTLMAISKINQYEKDSVNLVLASAVMLLIFNTNLLFSVGFQLSYCAVLGIILLYPKIYPMLYFKNKWLDMMWQIQVMSLVAVIGTAPLSIYYFYQFSTVFPITNLIAVPASYILVGLSVALFMCSSFAWLANLIGIALTFCTDILNDIIGYISAFSFSAIESLYINSIELILLTLLLFTLGIMIYQYHLAKKMMIASLIIFNLFCLYRGSRKMISNQQMEYLSYQKDGINKELLKVGNKLYLISDRNIEEAYPIQLDGLHRNWLVFNKENLTAFDLSAVKMEQKLASESKKPIFSSLGF
jgi:competence protein ComEC